MRKTYLLHFVLVIALLFTIGGASQALAADHQVQGMDSLEEVLRGVQLLHISEPDSQTLIKGAIEGLLEALNDPYTVYLTPEELREFRNSIEGNYAGIGVQMQPGKIYPIVLNTIENTPASRAGVRPGDLIIKIDGIDLSYEPLGKVVERVRGPEGTKLTMTIRREGTADFDIELTRANITTPTVSGTILDGGTGYIHINMFGDFTGDEFQETLDGLIKQGAAKLILDLRDNPGGIIHSALGVSSNFIRQGQVVVSTYDRDGNREEYLAEGDGDIIEDMPIAVLVNEYSASAAELLAGSLQDYGLATLIGGNTFGKGTVQAVIPLETGGALKITVARYYTPGERVIDGTGLKPDIQVLTPGLSLAIAYAYLNGNSESSIIIDRDKDEVMVNGFAIGNGRVIQLQGKTYLPLRLLFESLGYRVDWLPGEGAVRATKYQSEVFFYPGRGYYIVNGQTYPAVASVLSIEGNVYIQESLLTLFNAGVRYEGSAVIIEEKL